MVTPKWVSETGGGDVCVWSRSRGLRANMLPIGCTSVFSKQFVTVLDLEILVTELNVSHLGNPPLKCPLTAV